MKSLIPFALVLAALSPAARAAPTDADLVAMLKIIDDRQMNNGDYKSVAYLEQKERGKEDTAFEVVVYRRDVDDKLMILFTKPKAEAGKGYLRVDKNLFLYDPSVGKWERRTERERIAGTDSRRQDFDESRLAIEFTPTYVGEEKLGKKDTHHLTLNAKEGVDVAFPVVEVWVDKETGNLLKLFLNGQFDSQYTIKGMVLTNAGALYVGADPWRKGLKASYDSLAIFGFTWRSLLDFSG